MGTRLWLLYAVVILPMISTLCCTPNCYKEVKFELPINIYPDKSSYNQEDTIWIEVKLPYMMADQNTDENILVGPYPFKISLNILELLEDGFLDAFDSFQFIERTGELDTFGITYPRVELQFQNFPGEEFQLNKFGLVPKTHSTLYQFVFSKVNYSGDWSGVKHFPHDDCDYAIDESIYLTNNGGIDYSYYLNTLPYVHNPAVGTDTVTNLRNAGTFFVKVE